MKPEDITAYVLNELSAEERARIEAQLQASPQDKEKAQDLDVFCQLLTEQLGAEEASFTAEQREALLSLHEEGKVLAFDAQSQPEDRPAKVERQRRMDVRDRSSRSPGIVWIVGMAACLLFTVLVIRQSREDVETTGTLRSEARETSSVVQAEAVRVLNAPVNPSTKSEPLPPSPPQPMLQEKAKNLLTLGGAVVDLPVADPMPAAAAPLYKSATSVNAGVVFTGDLAIKSKLNASENGRDGIPKLQLGDADDDAFGNTVKSGTERYATIQENRFADPTSAPLSTFSIDVDTASYANVRRFLNEGRLPPADAVRLEELINYFPYSYEPPARNSEQPFAVQVDMAEAPWDATHRLARIGIKGREITGDRKPANVVFLIDVSGSMDEPNKLPLVKRSLTTLLAQLQPQDRVAIVTYAGESGLVLDSTATTAENRAKVQSSIEAMRPGGSTNGASGIQLAYEQAASHFIKDGINRVILCTDGDFNVGASSPEALEKLITEKAKTGVFLSVLGFGAGNLKDQTMETLADKGNGNYAYIDSFSEARKVLVEQMTGTLITIAKDVKIQVEFNPAQVRSYRLLGYEKRMLAKEDFNNDRKDAGEIGAGHTVTALYEVVPIDAPLATSRPLVDDLKYQPKSATALPTMTGVPPQKKLEGINDEVMTVKLRYKEPDGQVSKLLEVPVKDSHGKLKDASKEFQFATAVAGFGMMLRDSEHKGDLTWDRVRKLAIQGKGEDKLGYRGEFIQLIDKANGLSGRP